MHWLGICQKFILVLNKNYIQSLSDFHFIIEILFSFQRWYTKWFDKSPLDGTVLCLYTLNNRLKWEGAINEWQKPILDDS